MVIACPKCKSRYQLKDDAHADKVRCKKCQEIIDVRRAVVAEARTTLAAPSPAAPASTPDARTVVATPTPAARPSEMKTVVTPAPPSTPSDLKTVVSKPPAATAPTSEDDLTGRALGGYEVLRKLGQGGMGAVYEARQVSLDRSVALKVLPSDLAANKSFIVRFTREALSVAKLNHNNIVQVYDVGKAEGTYFFSMEFVRGTTLQRLVEKHGPLEPVTAVGYIMQAARGLEYAHRRNIVHRDIKPDNIMINEEGVAKVADLGLAKDVQEEEASVTMSGVGMGTPHYMSPEQATDAKHVDARADIYSLGCTLYQLLLGRIPFDGSSAFEIITKHVSEPLILPHKTNAKVPEELSEIVGRMMAKKREDRYANMTEVIAALEKYLGVNYAKAGFHPSEEQITQLQEHARAVSAIRNDSRARWARRGMVAVVALLALIGVAWAGWRFAVGVAACALLVPLGIAVFVGFTRKTYVYRRVRKLIFSNRIGDWVAMLITAAVVVALIILLHLTLTAILALIFSGAAVAGYCLGLRRPALIRQDAAVEEAKKFLRDFRRKGMPEEDIHLFVCQHGGPDGELLCEEMFGYEAVAAARAKRPPQDVARRPFGIRMREWLIDRIDRAEARRLRVKGAPARPGAEPATASAAPGTTTAVMTPAAAAPGTQAVSTQAAEAYLADLEQSGGALDTMKEIIRFLVGRKGRLAIGAVLVLLAVLSHKGTMFGDSAALKSWNYGVFALALAASGLTTGRTLLAGLALACVLTGPVVLFAGDSFLVHPASEFATQFEPLQKLLEFAGEYGPALGKLTLTAFGGALLGVVGIVLQTLFGDWW